MVSIKEAEEKMKKCGDAFQSDLTGIRSGRANTSLLDNVRVDVYGQQMPLTALASVNVMDSKTLSVTVWDSNNIKIIDHAIRSSDLSLNPRLEGNRMFIPLPELSSERRQELVKIVKKKCEEAKISIRNIRRDSIDSFRSLLKKKEITEDDLEVRSQEIQKITDTHIAGIDKLSENKQTELTKI